MNANTYKTDFISALHLGDHSITCAVIEKEGKPIRLLVERSMAKALGSKGGGSYWAKKKADEKSAHLPEYISLTKLRPFISEGLMQKLEIPYNVIDKSGRIMEAVEATALPDICDVWITAREKGALSSNQEVKAKNAYLLLKGFAHIGIIALVDEATGYQYLRDKLELDRILAKYLRDERLAWAKQFPDEYYIELFRLRGWKWQGMSVNRPSYVGKITNDIVYERLAPGVLTELKKRTPRDDKGRTKFRFHQWLSPDFGNPKLAQHLFALIAMMKANATWGGFYRGVQRAFTKAGETPELRLDE